jgi:putative chitinase
MISREAMKIVAPKGNAEIMDELAKAFAKHLIEYGIDNHLREAHFLAQAAHESAGFRTLHEYWGPTAAQKGYEGRKDLGNIKPGDGFKYRGRGIFQLTGRANYHVIGQKLELNLEGDPDLAANPDVATRIAGLYWQSRGLSALADHDDVLAITRKINGGLNGLADRRAYLIKAKGALIDKDHG